MEIRSTVIAIPVQDLGKSVSFYTQIFGLKTQIEEGMAIIELPNLSLFLMEKEAFEVYSQKAGRPALFPSAGVPAIFSCVLVSKEAVDKALEDAPQYGGKREAQAAIAPLCQGDEVPASFRCDVVSKETVEKALEDAPQYGGRREAKEAIDPSFGGYIGYLADPEGHLWELVFPLQQKDQ